MATRVLESNDPRIVAAGARKEKLRQRTWRPPASLQQTRPYAELRAASAFSFLDGSSLPEDLVEEAANRGLPAVALIDTNGVYGAPRFYKAAQQAGIKALVGAEVTVAGGHPERSGPERSEGSLPNKDKIPRGACPERKRGARNDRRSRLTLLVENRTGYKNLC